MLPLTQNNWIQMNYMTEDHMVTETPYLVKTKGPKLSSMQKALEYIL